MEAQNTTPVVNNAASAAAPAANAVAPKAVTAAPAAQLTAQPVAGKLTTTVETSPDNAEKKDQPQPFGSTWLIIVVIAVWVLFLYSSRKNTKKQQQEREDTLNSLAKGVKVVTIGRIHGTIVSTTETTFTIKPDPNREGTLTFDKEALLRIDNGEKDAKVNA